MISVHIHVHVHLVVDIDQSRYNQNGSQFDRVAHCARAFSLSQRVCLCAVWGLAADANLVRALVLVAWHHRACVSESLRPKANRSLIYRDRLSR